MALVGNCSILHKSPAKYTTGTVGFNDRANWNKPGMMRNRGDLTISTLWKYDAVPSGFYAGRAFFPPQKAGRLTSRQAFSVTAMATGSEGLPGSASSSFAVDASAIGGLIAGGIATATITVTASASVAGLAAGSASSTITFACSAQIGANAWGVANASIMVPASATAYALGYMQASTVDNTALTPATITSAVWSALKTDYNAAGTMGNALNNASSGGVDYNALAAAVWTNATRTLTSGAPTEAQIADAVWAQVIENGLSAEQIVRLMAAAMAGKVSGAGTSTITFAGLDGTTPRIVGTVDGAGNRTAVLLDGD